MKAIWKYPVPSSAEFSITMPPNPKILAVQVQNGSPQIWALVDTDSQAPKEKVYFRLFGTGHEHERAAFSGEFIGTFQVAELVFHLFRI